MDLDQLDQALTGHDVTATDAVAALAVLVLGTVVAVLVGRAIRAYFGRPQRQSQQVAKLVARVARWLIQIAAIAWALNILGFAMGSLTITVAILVVGVVLAARPLLENLGAAAVLSSRPAFGIGDEVEIDELRGEIIEITSRSTVLRLRDGRRVHVPNTQVVRDTVVVYTTEQARRSSFDVTLGLDVDVDAAERVMLEALGREEAIATDPPPSVRVRELTEGVRVSVRVWHPSPIADGNLAIDRAIRAVKAALDAAGMPLAVPQVDVRDAGGGPDA